MSGGECGNDKEVMAVAFVRDAFRNGSYGNGGHRKDFTSGNHHVEVRCSPWGVYYANVTVVANAAGVRVCLSSDVADLVMRDPGLLGQRHVTQEELLLMVHGGLTLLNTTDDLSFRHAMNVKILFESVAGLRELLVSRVLSLVMHRITRNLNGYQMAANDAILTFLRESPPPSAGLRLDFRNTMNSIVAFDGITDSMIKTCLEMTTEPALAFAMLADPGVNILKTVEAKSALADRSTSLMNMSLGRLNFLLHIAIIHLGMNRPMDPGVGDFVKTVELEAVLESLGVLHSRVLRGSRVFYPSQPYAANLIKVSPEDERLLQLVVKMIVAARVKWRLIKLERYGGNRHSLSYTNTWCEQGGAWPEDDIKEAEIKRIPVNGSTVARVFKNGPFERKCVLASERLVEYTLCGGNFSILACDQAQWLVPKNTARITTAMSRVRRSVLHGLYTPGTEIGRAWPYATRILVANVALAPLNCDLGIIRDNPEREYMLLQCLSENLVPDAEGTQFYTSENALLHKMLERYYGPNVVLPREVELVGWKNSTDHIALILGAVSLCVEKTDGAVSLKETCATNDDTAGLMSGAAVRNFYRTLQMPLTGINNANPGMPLLVKGRPLDTTVRLWLETCTTNKRSPGPVFTWSSGKFGNVLGTALVANSAAEELSQNTIGDTILIFTALVVVFVVSIKTQKYESFSLLALAIAVGGKGETMPWIDIYNTMKSREVNLTLAGKSNGLMIVLASTILTFAYPTPSEGAVLTAVLVTATLVIIQTVPMTLLKIEEQMAIDSVVLGLGHTNLSGSRMLVSGYKYPELRCADGVTPYLGPVSLAERTNEVAETFGYQIPAHTNVPQPKFVVSPIVVG
jgi:hypothetical protein